MIRCLQKMLINQIGKPKFVINALKLAHIRQSESSRDYVTTIFGKVDMANTNGSKTDVRRISENVDFEINLFSRRCRGFFKSKMEAHVLPKSIRISLKMH